MGGNVYAATKAFVAHFTLNLLADLQGKDVRVTCIAPGMAKTEFAQVRFDGDIKRAEALYEGVNPLKPEDVAEAVYWCYSLPARVNVNMVELMPTSQPFSLGFPKK
jgi:3-hydroxy acid dehydrogenase / malonic semialdehyde reductase